MSQCQDTVYLWLISLSDPFNTLTGDQPAFGDFTELYKSLLVYHISITCVWMEGKQERMGGLKPPLYTLQQQESLPQSKISKQIIVLAQSQICCFQTLLWDLKLHLKNCYPLPILVAWNWAKEILVTNSLLLISYLPLEWPNWVENPWQF